MTSYTKKLGVLSVMAALISTVLLSTLAYASEESELLQKIRSSQFREARLMLLKNPRLANANLTSQNQKALHYLAGTGDIQTVNFFIQKGANINVYDKIGIPPISIAVRNSDTRMVDLFLKKGFPIKMTYIRGTSSLMHDAVKSRQSERMINFLLWKKVDINIQNISGSTPLHTAAERNDKRICQYLLSRGASRTIQNKQGYTASETARLAGNSVIADLIR